MPLTNSLTCRDCAGDQHDDLTGVECETCLGTGGVFCVSCDDSLTLAVAIHSEVKPARPVGDQVVTAALCGACVAVAERQAA
jgi:hypothetical protein